MSEDVLVAACEGGGSRTDVIVLDGAGRCRGWGRAGTMMALYVGHDAAMASLQEAFGQATADIDPNELAVVCVSVPIIVKRVQEEMVRAVAADAELAFGHEGEVALMGAVGERRGVVVSAGTGSFAYGIDDSGEADYVGGGGPLLGDEGSAYYLGVRGLRYALHGLDGRKASTGLLEPMLEELAVSGREELLAKAYGPGLPRREVAALALIVIRRAEEGDAVARQVTEEAAAELVVMGRQVVHNLQQRGAGWRGRYCVVCVGGAMRRSPSLRRLVTLGMLSAIENAEGKEPRFSPAVGAALVALEQAGVEVHVGVLDQVAETLPAALRG